MDIVIDKFEYMDIIGIIEEIIKTAIVEPNNPPDAGDCVDDILSNLNITYKK